MVFSSLTFLYFFLPLNLILYFSIKNHSYRNAILIISSLAFYAWGEPVWIILLIVSASVDYLNARVIENNRGTWKAKAALVFSLIINLSFLATFKYSGFIIDNFNQLLGLNLPQGNFHLPIGISFYTFQTISYVIDVYRDEVKAQKSYFDFLLFVSLFHQLVAGPIVRYKDIASEIERRVITWSDFSQGINRFAIGLGKKAIIANTAGALSDPFLKGDLHQLSTLGAWYGIGLFALQIYFDFSGYSDMAIGLGRMFGFHYLENFNYPYISRTATEFWRRWHISLGSFFRDYVYIPLGGNKKQHLRNLLIVWFLTGLWHGASWNFVLWGLFYGILIILEKQFLAKLLDKLPKVMSHLYLLVAVLVGWVFFYYTDLNEVFLFMKVMFGFSTTGAFIDLSLSIDFFNNLVFIVIALIACTPLGSNGVRWIAAHLPSGKGKNLLLFFFGPVWNILLLFLSTSLLVGKTYNPFLYFRF